MSGSRFDLSEVVAQYCHAGPPAFCKPKTLYLAYCAFVAKDKTRDRLPKSNVVYDELHAMFPQITNLNEAGKPTRNFYGIGLRD